MASSNSIFGDCEAGMQKCQKTILSSVPIVFTGLVVLNMDILSMLRSYQSTVLQWTADSWPAAESQHDNTVAQ